MGYFSLRKISIYTGLSVLKIFIFMGIFGSHLAPYELTYQKGVEYVVEKGEPKLSAPPFGPSTEHILGTDQWGYDILTKILYGAKYTIFPVILISLFIIVIGVIFGSFMGLVYQQRSRKNNKYIKVIVSSGLPSFLIIYFILSGINFNSIFSPLELILFTSFLIVLLGFPSIANTIYLLILEVKNKPYVEASITLGGRSLHIFTTHIYPHIKVNILSLTISQCIQTLQLLGVLSIFNIFLGGTYYTETPYLFFSITNEWSGLIGQSRSNIYGNEWILLSPLTFYIILLLAFYLIYYGISEYGNRNYVYKKEKG
ncbi:ABC transporter permease [Cytobacillus kochii]|uniref:ABC transporter permease n=1 Tax=Cytobacillus kochii TaxID=859143 RepID=UPI00277DFCB6|nr:ABC transporter permease subunit [Cytobacillus kochii]MDQ0186657.1 peptide/nickel transport system permease protein [Cytobacillus kochii]